MDNWKKFNNTLLTEKEEFYSNLKIGDTTEADCMHAKMVCKDFELNDLGKYYNFYVQSDKLLLADVFDNFRNMS